MKRVNVLSGWRTPYEEPEKGADLLLVFRDTDTNKISIIRSNVDMEEERKYKRFKLLAWQYFPVWVED